MTEFIIGFVLGVTVGAPIYFLIVVLYLCWSGVPIEEEQKQ
jgi:hypothetical protein